ncbi:helix-turn-helix domain-containing protein [Nocardia coffeae]|uniref:helix-turn-helix domain-containing protein n=1 Tax=Nocardia coffeae TaxID=2873381 RepID=UPI0022A7BA69|nr:helix-turn-helix transcriptional regulator [Nocardia coffeae]
MVVRQWTRCEVRALRVVALRLTQEKFAERAGYSAAAVGKWERATSERPVRGESAQDLDTVLAQLDPEQRARFRSAVDILDDDGAKHARSATSPPRAVRGEYRDGQKADGDVKRREFGKLTATTALAITLPGNHNRIGMSDAQRLSDDIDALDKADQQSGGAVLVDFAVQHLGKAKERLLTGVFADRSGRAFTTATGELSVLTGWLAYDSDRQALAQSCYADAMALGVEAGDTELIAHTCLYAANQAISLVRSGRGGSLHRALQLIDRARDLMRGRPPGRIHALIAIREAQARGLLGELQAFERAVATAHRELECAVQYEPLEAVPQWLRFVTHSEVADHEARGYADIGKLGRAVELYCAAMQHPAAPRNITNIRAWSAATRAALGDINGALEEGMTVLADLSTVSSTRTLRHLEPVRTAAARAGVGADFRAAYDSLDQKVITA